MLEVGKATLAVFSHPNHELAIFGLLQRLKPYVIYLSDGGAQVRVEETRKGLKSIGQLDRATFLNYPENAFYDALLRRDSKFYLEIADAVRKYSEGIGADQILCDAVEFYNPVHDMSLPIVRSALRGSNQTPVFEVPLIYQEAAAEELYNVQRLPASRARNQIQFSLCDSEVDAKMSARAEIYETLVSQMGRVISDLPREHLAVECLAKARPFVPKPDIDVVLRYERRAQILAEQGEIEEKINYEEHYVPLATSLVNAPQPNRLA